MLAVKILFIIINLIGGIISAENLYGIELFFAIAFSIIGIIFALMI